MKIALIMVAALLVGCTNENKSLNALESQGFSDVTFTGYSVFACGEDDTYATGFRAKNPKGQMVEGTVCCGLIGKACTIRW